MKVGKVRPCPESWRIRSALKVDESDLFLTYFDMKTKAVAGTVTKVRPKELGWVHSLGLYHIWQLWKRFQVWTRPLHVMSVSTWIKDRWLMLMMYDDSWWSTVDAGGSSKSNAGRWTTWLLTKTHHTDTSNPEVPSRKRRSGDLGKLFHWDPLGTKFDKVEKYSRGDVGAVGRIDWFDWLNLALLGSTFFAMILYHILYPLRWFP